MREATAPSAVRGGGVIVFLFVFILAFLSWVEVKLLAGTIEYSGFFFYIRSNRIHSPRQIHKIVLAETGDNSFFVTEVSVIYTTLKIDGYRGQRTSS
jgi:hypothetical protein